ncbi:MAG: hypothetical protein ACOY3P_07785 [Planctomycetota bacterium]
MDPNQYRSRFLWRLLGSPWVSVPAGLGAASLGLALAMGEPQSYLTIVGISGVLLGVASAATRWIFQFDQISQATFDDLQSETERTQYAFLDQLERRLRVDGDARTRKSVADLRKIFRRLERAGMMGENVDQALVPDIREKALQLYQSCLKSLEGTVEYWQAAQEMATEAARDQMLQARESLLTEVSRSIYHLGATLDHLRSASLKRDRQGNEMAQMREELELGLQVAQRVEQRMSQFESDLRDPARMREPPSA